MSAGDAPAAFAIVDMRAGTIVEVEPFPQARKPAYKLTVDFGAELGLRRSMHRSPRSTPPAS